MKKAFTMLELVFVIVVLGILSYMVASSFQRNPLREAADQVVMHIRYTQHLAMMDDRFDPNESNWYLGRWQIVFANNSGSDNQWAYTIFSDWKGGHDGNPNPATSTAKSELAYNPQDGTKYLTGGTSGTNLVHYGDAEATKALNLGHAYGITNIIISGGNTGSTASRIIFDEIGRPYRGNTNSGTSTVINSLVDRIATTPITVTLISNDQNMTIAIEPETGYTHIQ